MIFSDEFLFFRRALEQWENTEHQKYLLDEKYKKLAEKLRSAKESLSFIAVDAALALEENEHPVLKSVLMVAKEALEKIDE